LAQQLIEEGVLDYWSSGSTTYITLKGYQPGSGETPEGE
ncbi:MAG: dissimilatory sulfite reductase-asociated protein DsvD, partial [Candidatus Lindowbacteria bacterium]|nr:dissimilatory sulfite reductase-asociated protein DsvD [Candidatus Lindowbacteria bacterium]